METVVNEKVEAKQFEGVVHCMRLDFWMDGSDSLSGNLLHVFIQVFHRMFFLNVIGIEISLELRVAELIAGLELAVLFTITLDSVIGQMDVNVVNVIGVVVLGAGPDVAFIVPKIFSGWAHSDHKEVGADVELSFLVEEKVAQVGLNDELAALFARYELLSD